MSNDFPLSRPGFCRKISVDCSEPMVLIRYLELELSNAKKGAPGGCLGFIGDEILPSYIGIISQIKIRIPLKQPLKWKIRPGFFVAQVCWLLGGLME